MKIRNAEPRDHAAMLDIWAAASAVAHAFLGSAAIEAQRALVRDVYIPGAENMVAEDGEAILGFIGLLGRHIGGLFVSPAAHRRGVGRALVEHAAALRGPLSVEVYEANESARAFYARLGFLPLARKPLDDQGRPVPLIRLARPAAPREGGWRILTGLEAAAAADPQAIAALTAEATRTGFDAGWLSQEQRAANRRVVDKSAAVCAAAAVSDTQHFAAAIDAHGLAGFVIATVHGPEDRELDWLMVRPDRHGSGIADALMLEGLAWLGLDRPAWLNVIRHNERAIRFYRRFGFEIDAAAATPHAVPHWIMRRPPLECAPERSDSFRSHEGARRERPPAPRRTQRE
jgi:putative acetyltransferase